MVQTRVPSLSTSTELALCLIMSVWVIIQCSDQYEWPLCSQGWDAAVANSVGFWHVLRVWLFHMGNTAPSGIVLYPGYRRRSICEWAPVCGRLHLMVISSTFAIKMPQFGEMRRNLVACSVILLLSCLLSLSLASSTFFFAPLFTLFLFFWCLDHLVIPTQLVISQLAGIIIEYATTLPRDGGSLAWAFDWRFSTTRSKGLQSHQIFEKPLMHRLNQLGQQGKPDD